VRIAGQLLGGATGARWPMYLRNAKQILRAGNFDERRYGFGGLIELLKACQRDGLVRIERDRRGGLRVFQGSNLVRTAAPAAVHAPAGNLPQPDVEGEDLDEVQPFRAEPRPIDVVDVDGDIVEPDTIQVVDTTAELLGRAKARKPRVRASALGDDGGSERKSRTPRKSAPKKGGGSARRPSRAKKLEGE
jgi:hypothetical protein